AHMVPVAGVPPQDLGPWSDALPRLLHAPAHYDDIAHRSRDAALEYASQLNAGPFEAVLRDALAKPATIVAAPKQTDALSPEKRKLLALRLRKKAPAAAWFPGIDREGDRRL